ncbi:family 10 glycosylhydrolase [Geminocystis sp.]|uniref:family 10 glycosylhydrolase n=1 Tax=Geminocystis sp. TaxID=2664100 RepID=UPI0035939293
MLKNSWTKFTLTLITIVSQTFFKLPVSAVTNSYCQLDQNTITTKENLRQKAIAGNTAAQQEYKQMLQQHGNLLRNCRQNNWLKEQAIWVRLYPCDVQAGSIDKVLDTIVNQGYNAVYLEVFFDSQVLLPKNGNYTPWPSVIDVSGQENRDLYAETLQKGRERGLKVYAWLFSMNFGYLYSQKPDRQPALARNGKGQSSIDVVHDQSQAFIDPYNSQARQDYTQLLQAVIQRRPDGVLFDYIRYPRGSGQQSVVSKVKDLWIYGDASKQTLFRRAQNQQGRWLLERYVNQGFINANDIAQMKNLYPDEKTPLWQGRSASAPNTLSALQIDIWYFTVAHAAQGVIDFLDFASNQVKQRGITTGAVFFPDGNQVVGDVGFDSRLQPWDSFSQNMEWHSMSYALCGNPNCIVDQVKRVLSASSQGSNVMPVLAGFWGRDDGKRPSLESQMEAMRTSAKPVQSISHFAYSWLYPEHTRQRQSCSL